MVPANPEKLPAGDDPRGASALARPGDAPPPADPFEILVLNLRQAVARRRLAHAQLDVPGMPPYRLIEAIDGAALDDKALAAAYDDQAAIRHAGRSLTRPEIGCAMSHLAAYRHIVERDLPFGVIVEDDALIGLHAMRVLRQLVRMIDPKLPQVVLLSRAGRYSAWGARKVDRIHRLYKAHEPNGAYGYLVTQAGARALLQALQPVFTAADNWRHLTRRRIVEVYCLIPYCIGIAALGEGSHIGEERFEVERPRTVGRWFRKYIYQKFIFQLLVKPLRRLRKHESTW